MKPTIPFSDFAKLDIRVGEVKDAVEVAGSTKLLKLTVEFGKEIGVRTIYAGIRVWYESGKLAGRKLAFVVNLEPKRFKIGEVELESQGMLLAADSGGKAILYQFDEDLITGSIIK